MTEPYYRADLARIHHDGFGFHADAVAPGVLRILEPVRERDGVVVEIGCGTGLLTRYLVDAEHRVIATDASPAMLDLVRLHVPDAEDVRALRLPHDPVPAADAVVSVGHPLSYVADRAELEASLMAIAHALQPGGVLAFDLCDVRWGEARLDQGPLVWSGDDWMLISRTTVPDRSTFRRDLTTFTREPGGLWRRDDEVHLNVLVDTADIPAVLARAGVDADVRDAFGAETLPTGLVAIVGGGPPPPRSRPGSSPGGIVDPPNPIRHATSGRPPDVNPSTGRGP